MRVELWCVLSDVDVDVGVGVGTVKVVCARNRVNT